MRKTKTPNSAREFADINEESNGVEVKSVVHPVGTAVTELCPAENVLATVLKFTEWLNNYGEVSYDFQSIYSSDWAGGESPVLQEAFAGSRGRLSDGAL